MVEPDGTARLIDFGASAEVDENAATSVAVIKHFYVPEEQYDTNRRRQGPWTDVYAISATIFRALEGSTLPDSHDRLRGMPFDGFTVTVTPAVKNAVIHGVALFQNDRAQNVDELIQAFSVPSGTAVYKKPKVPKTPKTVVANAENPKKSAKQLAAILGGIAAAAAVLCLVIFLPRTSVPTSGETVTTSAETTTEITTETTIAQTEASKTFGDWEYTMDDVSGEVTITKYNGSYSNNNSNSQGEKYTQVEITLPEVIQGKYVTMINSDVFASNSGAKTIILTVPQMLTKVNNRNNTQNYMVLLKDYNPNIINGGKKWITFGEINQQNSLGYFYKGFEYNGSVDHGLPNGYGKLATDEGILYGFFKDGVYQGTEEPSPENR
jgi:hypothetical protein